MTGGTLTGNIYGDDRDSPALGGDDDTFTWTGGKLTGGFYGQDGSDAATVSAPEYDGSQVLDGGDDTSIADGMTDRLNLVDVSATSNGSKIVNWEIVDLDQTSLSIDDGAWKVGEPDEDTTGVFLRNASTLDGLAALGFHGNLDIDSTSTFIGRGNGAGAYSISGNVVNAGTITMLDTAAGDTVTIAGDYVGSGGNLLIDTVLGDDSSKTDKLVVGGATSGTSNLTVNNVGGTGARTIEGIRIVEVTGVSDGTFLLVGDYEFQGEQAVVAGAYAYRLYKGGISTPADGDWYLRSQLTNPADPVDPPPTPLLQPGVPVYEAYPQTLLALSELPTLQQRVGNRFWVGSGKQGAGQGSRSLHAAPESAGVAVDANGIWGRIEAAHTRDDPRVSTTATRYDQNTLKFQVGSDGMLTETESGQLVGGLT